MIAWFMYELAVYGVHVYAPEQRILVLIALVVAAIFTLFALGTHLLF
jgi:hypothetical protein